MDDSYDLEGFERESELVNASGKSARVIGDGIRVCIS
jgi:hypothetical protein